MPHGHEFVYLRSVVGSQVTHRPGDYLAKGTAIQNARRNSLEVAVSVQRRKIRHIMPACVHS